MSEACEAQLKLSERYYVYHLRAMMLTLFMVVCLAAYNLMRVFEPARNSDPLAGLAGSTIILIVYIVSLFAVEFITLGGRRWRVRDPQVQAILRDEWTRTNLKRAQQTAFWVMLGAQWPMMFFMAYAPPEPSVVGMGTMTMVLGIGAYFASYLYFIRQQSDG